MPSLYKLTNEAVEILAIEANHYTDTDGELDEAFESSLSEWLSRHEGDVEAKINGYLATLRNKEALATDRREEEKRLAALRKTTENEIERMKNALRFYLEATGQTGMETTLGKISLRTSGNRPVVLSPAFESDPALLPDKYRRTKHSADLTALGLDLKAGDEEATQYAAFGEAKVSLSIK